MATAVQARFSDNELKSLAINAMGRASETGTFAVMKLGLATNVEAKTGVILYTDNNSSGYTIGYLQWDFGAKKNGKALIDAYNASDYVAQHPKKAIAADQIEKLTARLNQNRDGAAEVGVKNTDLRREEVGKNLGEFLQTAEGYKFIMQLQEQQYEQNSGGSKSSLKSEMKKAMTSPALTGLPAKSAASKDAPESAAVAVKPPMTDADARIVLAVAAKLKNQTGSIKGDIATTLNDPKTTKDSFLEKVYSIYHKPKAIKDETGKVTGYKGGEVYKGVQATIKGVNLFNALANDQGRIGKLFRAYNKLDPLDVVDFHSSGQDKLIDAMFRHPWQGHALIKAVENGKNYQIKPEKRIQNESYTSGVKDGKIFAVDKDGVAQEVVIQSREEQKTIAAAAAEKAAAEKAPAEAKISTGDLSLDRLLNAAANNDSAAIMRQTDDLFGRTDMQQLNRELLGTAEQQQMMPQQQQQQELERQQQEQVQEQSKAQLRTIGM